MYNKLSKLSKFVAKMTSRIASILLAFVAIILFGQVVLRYVFNAALPWPEEASRYLMIWAVMLISNVLIKEQELITVDFFDKLWPTKVVLYRDIAYRLLLLVLLVVLFKEGLIQAIVEKRQTTTALNISWFWPYLAIPVGTGLMLFQMIFLMLNDIVNYKRKRV